MNNNSISLRALLATSVGHEEIARVTRLKAQDVVCENGRPDYRQEQRDDLARVFKGEARLAADVAARVAALPPKELALFRKTLPEMHSVRYIPYGCPERLALILQDAFVIRAARGKRSSRLKEVETLAVRGDRQARPTEMTLRSKTESSAMRALPSNRFGKTNFGWCEPGEELADAYVEDHGSYGHHVSNATIRLPLGWLDSDAAMLTSKGGVMVLRAEEVIPSTPGAPDAWTLAAHAAVGFRRLFHAVIVRKGRGATTNDPEGVFCLEGDDAVAFGASLIPLLKRHGYVSERAAKARQDKAAAAEDRAAARAAWTPLSESVDVDAMAAAIVAQQAALRAEIIGLGR